MILAIDVGNTNIVVGLADKTGVKSQFRIHTDSKKTFEEYWFLLKNCIEVSGFNKNDFEGGIISSVVAGVNESMAEAMRRVTGMPPVIVRHGIKTGLKIQIDNPASLGADLVVDAVAGLAKYEPPLLIFDLGTATTMSYIDKEGIYRGGAILPGIKLSMNALSMSTSSLPSVDISKVSGIIGKNTISCMQSGAIYGHAGIIDGMIERVEDEIGEKVTSIVTGGLSSTVLSYCRRKIIYEPDLILEGLIEIYYKNK